MSTQCRFCGEAVRPDSMFCPACGQIIGMPGSAVPPFPGGATPPPSGAPVIERRVEPLAPVPLPAPLAAEQPAAPQEPAPAPVTATAANVSLPTGERIELDRVLVFGRSPESGAAAYQGTPVRLDDPERAMSRVHLVLSPTAVGVVATDPGSANGTLLERAGTQYALVAGTPSVIEPGDRLLLGDCVLVVG